MGTNVLEKSSRSVPWTPHGKPLGPRCSPGWAPGSKKVTKVHKYMISCGFVDRSRVPFLVRLGPRSLAESCARGRDQAVITAALGGPSISHASRSSRPFRVPDLVTGLGTQWQTLCSPWVGPSLGAASGGQAAVPCQGQCFVEGRGRVGGSEATQARVKAGRSSPDWPLGSINVLKVMKIDDFK